MSLKKIESREKLNFYHNIEIPSSFLKPPSKLKTILTNSELDEIKKILLKYNYFELKYNGNISKRTFWNEHLPNLANKIFDDFERFKQIYELNFAKYLLWGLFNSDRNKTNNSILRKFKSIDDFIKNAHYVDVTNKFNNKLLQNDDYKKYLNFKPSKISELMFCIFANIKDKPKCNYCKNIVEFVDLQYGYREFCSFECQSAFNNSKKEAKLSPLNDDEIRNIIAKIIPDKRNMCNQEIANVFQNIYNYSKKIEDLQDKERIYLFLFKKNVDEIFCNCGKKRKFLSQTRGYNKTCGNIACVIKYQNKKWKKPYEQYTNTIINNSKINSFIYIFYSKSLNIYKIGISNNPYVRLKHLQNFIDDLEIIFSVFIKETEKLEKYIHKQYFNNKYTLENNIDGYSEFFKLNKIDLKNIKNIIIKECFDEN